jgi:hypothetical protein
MLLLAVVGGSGVPPWAGGLPGGLARVTPVAAPVERGFNRALASAPEPFFLAAQADDRLDPTGLLRLLDALRNAPPAVAGATGRTDRVRRSGGLAAVAARTFASSREVLGASRLPHPVLLRTAALRAAGGWHPGEAAWEQRPNRQRGLLARLAEAGPIIGCAVYLGEVAVAALPPSLEDATPMGSPADLHHVLEGLLYRRVKVSGQGLAATGRVAAVTPALLTLAVDGGEITLLPMERITALEPMDRLP